MKIGFEKIVNIKKLDRNVKILKVSCDPIPYYVSNGIISHNCDSKYSWKNIETKEISYLDILDKMKDKENIVFTGGEPLLPINLNHITKITKSSSYRTFEIETNGTLLIKDSDYQFFKETSKKILFNISPKGNISQEKECELEPIFILQIKNLREKNYNIDYIVKFLFSEDKDIHYIKHIENKYEIPKNKIWCQPMGVDSETLTKTINEYFPVIIENGWNISLRSHIFLFQNKRGV